jgi:hypothetical protein
MVPPYKPDEWGVSLFDIALEGGSIRSNAVVCQGNIGRTMRDAAQMRELTKEQNAFQLTG